MTGRISLTVRNLYPASKQQRASVRAFHVCADRHARPPFDAKPVPFTFPTVLPPPLWPPANQLSAGTSLKPPVPEATKSIQYP